MGWVVATGLWLLVLVNLPRLRGPREERPLLWAAFWAAIALTGNVDEVHVQLDRLAHRPNLATLVEHAAEILAVTFMAEIFSAIAAAAADRPPPASRRKVRFALGTISLLAVLFFLSPVDTESLHFAADYGHVPSVTVFWGVSMAYLAWVAARLLIVTSTYYQRVTRRSIQAAFVLTALGSAALLPFCAAKMIVTLNHVITGWPQTLAESLDAPLMAVAVLLYALGLSVPSLLAWSSQLGRRAEDYFLLQALRPMWHSLTREIPDATLGPTHAVWKDLLPGRIHLRLSSRVVEIRDVQLVLAGYVTSADRSSEGVGGAAAEASWTATALCRRKLDEAPRSSGREFVEGRESITDEAKYLVAVWRNMTLLNTATREPGATIGLVSKVFSPTLVASVVSLAGGLAAGRGLVAGLGWGLLSVAIAPLLPGVVFALVRSQLAAADKKDATRRARVVPLIAAVAVVIVGVCILVGLEAPRLTVATAAAMAAGLLGLMAARSRTNVSAHVSIAAGAMAFAVLVFSPWWFLTAAGVFLVGKSRLALGAHTLTQVLWAVPIGFGACALPLMVAGYQGRWA